MNDIITILQGDCRDVLKTLPAESVHCVVTSPPYFGLRDYNCDGQIGLEPSPDEYVAVMVEVFREVRRVLRSDGVLFLNLGDSYTASGVGAHKNWHANPGMSKSASRGGVQHVRLNGNGDKATQDYPENDSLFGNPYDAHKDSELSRTSYIYARPSLELVVESCLRIQARMVELRDHLPIAGCSDQRQTSQSLISILDHWQSAIREFEPLFASLESKMPEFLPRLRDGKMLVDMLSAYLSSLRSFDGYAQACARMLDAGVKSLDYKIDISLLFAGLSSHIQYTFACYSSLVSYLTIRNIQPYGSTILKPKDLIGIPWRVAFALQADGWYLRSDIIWSKSNCMPESVTDRPTKAHEYLFLLSKSQSYYYDADAIREPLTNATLEREKYGRPRNEHKAFRAGIYHSNEAMPSHFGSQNSNMCGRNRRSVWTVPTRPYNGSHFAVFPPDLIRPCILAGCPIGGVTLDPFAGSGTTGKVALETGRKAILIELNPEYLKLIRKRCTTTLGLPLTSEVSL